MRYLWINYLVHEEDDPTESYVELDENRLERRRADLYDNGMAFAYGGSPRGPGDPVQGALPGEPPDPEPPGEVHVTLIRSEDFDFLWYQLPDRPSGFAGMF